MKISLKVKLTLSYILLSLFLVSALLVVSNRLLNQKFQSYIMETQENKNQNIVDLVTETFNKNSQKPSIEALESIGNTALSQGMVLMVTDLKKNEIFCMSTVDSRMCDNMIESMRAKMATIYPNFKGAYTQKKYDIIVEDTKIGIVTLGYYGPFYYEDADVQFLKVLNGVFLGISIVFLIIATLLGVFMAGRISKPIKKVIDQTKEIETGNYTNRLTNISKTKEINQLIHSINTLADTLESQQRSKRRMAQDYAHEFCTPLATLQSNLEAMIDGIWEPTNERLESCREEILRLTRMISEIDKIVKIENDRLVLQKTTFDLADVVKQAVVNMQLDVATKHLHLENTTSSCEIYADKDKIMQVILNLLTNAIKYTDSEGSIKIELENYNTKVELKISDTGIGIGKEDLPNVFEYLYRADKSRNRDTGGSGIGLSVVKAIVEAHGGTIRAKSELGKGSEFTVTLRKE